MRKWFRPLPVWVALVGLLVLGEVLAPPSGSWRYAAHMAVIGFPSLVLALAVHELGHLLGGYLAGFRFVLFTLGPVKVARTRDGFRWGVNDAWLPLASACSVPVDLARLKRGCAMATAAGPAANLLLAAAVGVTFLAWILMAPRPGALIRHWIVHSDSEYGVAAVCWITYTSLACGLFNLIPFHEAYYTSDGGRLLLLRRGGPKADRLAANFGILAVSMSGQRPREWAPGLITRATQLPDGSPEHGAGCMMAYARALDLGDGETARAHLERARSIFGKMPLLKTPVELEAAYLEARFGREPARARALLDAARRESRDRDAHRVAEVAVLLAENRADEARARVPEALAALRRGNPAEAGINVMYAEWLRAVGGEMLDSKGNAAHLVTDRKAIGL